MLEEVTKTLEQVVGILVEEVPESSSAPEVQLDVVGLDVVVTIDDALLDTEDTTESTL